MKENSTLYPDSVDILEAASRIDAFINHTPVMTSHYIDGISDAHIFFKCENFQKVGAFKARGATNAILTLDADQQAFGVATHSSGNHAQALSWAASRVNIPSYIVMPSNSSRVKVDAVKGYGGQITFCKPTLKAREDTLKKILKETGATEIHSYNHPRIIAGQATAALELIKEVNDLDIIMAPVGGGGLLSGTALATHYFLPVAEVIGVEPEQANDAFLSFKSKHFVPSRDPKTIADGLRTSLGTLTYPIILDHVHAIVTVSEENIVKAMRTIWERMKIIIEPSSAVPFAALLENNSRFAGKRIGLIISGGNVDLDNLPWINL
ncbi:MAG: pyridoxal-phosphate dependent enzyme [Bacteroidales bacterium]|jgi:threonine dehydratase|nr:pyridoxal-phosphate dependent enzyme [Bacteroidales bacterium]